MQLRLRKIRLENWKCYRSQEIEFSQTDDKNISVIFGSNGFGKTSLLEAIRWCLYGSEAISKSDIRSRFNRVAAKQDANLSLAVQLTFEVGTEVILITRDARRIARGSAVDVEIAEPTFKRDGKNETNPRQHIEDLLPGACNEFYFFDGVEIKRYAQNVHTAEMQNAIERILGIPELRNLRDDARRALSSLDAELSRVQSSQPELKRVSDQLQDQIEDQHILKQQIELAQSEHGAAEEILDGLRAEATQQEALRSQLETLERKGRDVDRLNRDLDDVTVSFNRAMRHAPIPLLTVFITAVSSDLQRRSFSSARRSGISAQLKAILETSMCICGRELDDRAHSYIAQQIVDEPEAGDLRQSMADEAERNKLELLALYKAPDFSDLLAKRDRLANDLDGLYQEIALLKKSGIEAASTSVNELWRNVGDAEANVKARRATIDSLQREFDSAENSVLDLRRQRENLASRFAETATLAAQCVLARTLLQAADDLITWRVSESRANIERITSEIHRSVTNKPAEYIGVEISALDYSLRLVSAGGELLDPDTLSAGEKEALAFSFIAGLNIASNKSAPFIMDTPFGHLDVSHQRNFIAALPRLPSQVTLLATDRDLPEPLLGELRSSIADIYNISRVGATDDASVIAVGN